MRIFDQAKRVLCALSMVASVAVANAESAGTAAPFKLPVAAAWLYMSDDNAYNTIPDTWKKIDFSKVDVLFVGPAGIQADGSFGLYSSAETGDLATRFEWVITTARAANKNIKIVLSQWWGQDNPDHPWGRALDALDAQHVDQYATTLAAFLQRYNDAKLRVDGFDIDYEANNVVPLIPTLLPAIRAKLNSVDNAVAYAITVSPSQTGYLNGLAKTIDYVNMQTYAGGMYLTPQMFTSIGYGAKQLLYGICPESNCATPSVKQVEAAYTKNKLAGIHLWRLNSDNYAAENKVQAQIFKFLHP